MPACAGARAMVPPDSVVEFEVGRGLRPATARTTRPCGRRRWKATGATRCRVQITSLELHGQCLVELAMPHRGPALVQRWWGRWTSPPGPLARAGTTRRVLCPRRGRRGRTDAAVGDGV